MNPLRQGRLLLAAHRGVSGGNIPCNSEAAFKAAVRQGADIIELDVTRALDGTLFVFHPGMEHAHLTRPWPLRLQRASAVARRRYCNQDNAKTTYGVLTLDDALELLKGSCLLNIDKYWTAPQAITACIRRHKMEAQVLVKTPASPRYFDAVERIAPDLAYLPMVRETDDVSASLLHRRLHFVGIEAIFQTPQAQVISDAHVAWLHQNDLALWGNAIVYNRRAVISAGHTDDLAVTGDPDAGWGWFLDKGFDVMQTDWLLAAKQYFEGEQ